MLSFHRATYDSAFAFYNRPNPKLVISTGVAHASVSSGTEKPASLPAALPSKN